MSLPKDHEDDEGTAVHDLPPDVHSFPRSSPPREAREPAEEGRAAPPEEGPAESGAGSAGASSNAGAASTAGAVDVDAVDPEEDPRLDGAGLSAARLQGVLESLLFVSDRPLTLERLRELLPALPPLALRTALEHIAQRHAGGDHGLRLHQVAGGYQLRTAPHSAPYVQKLLQAKPVRLSRAQLETLAIVAYRQPITRPEIDDIRGVDSGGTLKMLLERGLLRILGKKEEPGRPMLYGTTREFLEFFNLRDLRDLPTLREFYELSEEQRGQVDAAAKGQWDVEQDGAPRPEEQKAPPPLTRIELKDLNLGDDEGQLREIDSMIDAVRTDFKLEEVLGVAQGAGVGGAGAAAGAVGVDERAPHDDDRDGAGDGAGDDDREPEEL